MKHLLFYSLIFCSCHLFSQKFEEGIVIQEGDTISGFIQNGKRAIREQRLVFKTDTGAQTYVYKPTDIDGYVLSGKQPVISKSTDSTFLFLDVIIIGEASLYRNGGDFYIEKDNVLHGLKNDLIEIRQGDNIILQQSGEYKKILRFLINDCLSEENSVEEWSSLSESKLTKLITAYNLCNGGVNIQPKGHIESIIIDKKILVGLTNSKINFNVPQTQFQTPLNQFLTTNFQSINPLIFGLSFDFLFPRINNQFSLYTEIQYHKSKYSNSTNEDGSSFVNNYQVNISTNELKLPIGTKFRTRTYGSFFIKSGLSTTLNFNTTSLLTTTTTYSDQSTTVEQRKILPPRNFQTGFWIGLEKEWKKAKSKPAIELRYEYTNGFSRGSYTGISTVVTKPSVSNTSILFSILF